MNKKIMALIACSIAYTVQAQQNILKEYNNYDFVAGDKILFEDNFLGDQKGEFAAHWNLKSGQAVVNDIATKTSLLITAGNYAKVFPIMKAENYLTDSFTVEFDFYVPAYPILLFLKSKDKDSRAINFGYRVNTNNFQNELSENYPEGRDSDFKKKWHHAALVYKNGQIKCYEDQYRILVIPQCGFIPQSILFGGIGSKETPICLTNVKIASGGNMNMLTKILTEGKFVTHSITFDVNKSNIKPESMGFINQLSKVLQENPLLKLEIDGYTDSDGDDEANLKLSYERAEAVKQQLIVLGINTSRLISKGFGETNPVDNNSTLEGKANNRRVEFIKK